MHAYPFYIEWFWPPHCLYDGCCCCIIEPLSVDALDNAHHLSVDLVQHWEKCLTITKGFNINQGDAGGQAKKLLQPLYAPGVSRRHDDK